MLSNISNTKLHTNQNLAVLKNKCPNVADLLKGNSDTDRNLHPDPKLNPNCNSNHVGFLTVNAAATSGPSPRNMAPALTHVVQTCEVAEHKHNTSANH